MTSENKNSILSLINDYKLSEAFAALDKLHLQNPDYSKLKQEFIRGNSTVDFVDRLIVLVNNIETEGQNTAINKTEQAQIIQNAEKIYNIGHIDKADFS